MNLENQIEERKIKLLSELFKMGDYLKNVFIESTCKMEFQFKKNKEIISEHDLIINNEIYSIRNQFFPQDGFLSEEAEYEKRQNDFTWILDPIDGSSNFVYSVNLFCISLSIMYQEKAVLSFIVDPLKGLIYLSILDKNYIQFKDRQVAIQPLYTKESSLQETDYFIGGSVFAKYKIKMMEGIKTTFYPFFENGDYYRSMGCIAMEIILGSLRPYFTHFTLKTRSFDVLAALHFAVNMGYSFLIGEKYEFLFIYTHVLEKDPHIQKMIKSVQKEWKTCPLNFIKVLDNE